MVKVGDRVRVGTWDIPVIVDRVYFVDGRGDECFEFEAAATMLKLNWGERGVSRVSLHDEGTVWFKYLELN